MTSWLNTTSWLDTTDFETASQAPTTHENGDVYAPSRRVSSDQGTLRSLDPEARKLKGDENVYPADAFSTPRTILFVATVCTSMFMNQVGLANTLTTVGVIGEFYGITNAGQLSWLIAGYSLTIGTFILVGGRMGDEFGNKKLFVIGMLWNALWCMVGGLAVYSTDVLFIFARVLQGIGPALTLPNALAIFGKSYSPGPRRNMAFAWFAAAAPFGAVFGFAFGPLFALAWWPWIYWSSAIATAGLGAFAAWAIPPVPTDGEQYRTRRDRLVALDIPGMVTGVATLILFNFAWNQAVVVTWKQSYVYFCLILSFIFGAAFFYNEIYVAKAPILPVGAFNSDISFVFGCTATGWAFFGIWVFYLPQMALNLGGATPIQLSAWLAPTLPVGILSALAVGKLLGKVPHSWIMMAGQTCYLGGSIIAAIRPPHSIYWTYFFTSLVVCVPGMDTSIPAATLIFSNAVERKYQGMGASVVMTIVNYSISLGLGFAGTLETNINNGGLTYEDRLHGYRGALWLAVGLAGSGWVLSLVFEGKRLWKKRSRRL